MRHKSLVRFVLMAVMFWIVSASWAAPLKPVLFYSKTEKGMGNRSYTFRFSLWDAETGGNRVWEEEKTLKAKNSVLNTYLGEVNSIEGVDFGQALWVQVEKKETDGTYEIIGERDEFTGVPFAMWALTPAGPKGDKGDKGDQGDTGPQGAQGLQGSTGPTGPQGPIGATGPVGPIGPVGPQGAIGSQGLTGPQGIQGPMGPTGPQGPKGDIGPMGLQGPDGPMGPRGMPGHAQVYDAQGQFLGLLLDFKACAYSIYLCEGNELPGTAFVISLFVPSLSKIFNLDVDTGDSVHVRVILYDADDCAGASYINGTPYEIFKLGSKYITGDIRQRATIKSIFEFNTTTTRCVASGGYEQWVATYREVALPFTTPVALPIHFVY